MCRTSECTLASEDEVFMRRQEEKERRQDVALKRQNAALEKAGKNPTRKALMEALTNGSYDFGGFKMTFGPNDNRGSDDVYLTVIGSDGTFKAVSSLSA